MENIEDRLRKASMTSSIHELQDDSGVVAGLSSGLEPPIPDAAEQVSWTVDTYFIKTFQV